MAGKVSLPTAALGREYTLVERKNCHSPRFGTGQQVAPA